MFKTSGLQPRDRDTRRWHYTAIAEDGLRHYVRFLGPDGKRSMVMCDMWFQQLSEPCNLGERPVNCIACLGVW